MKNASISKYLMILLYIWYWINTMKIMNGSSRNNFPRYNTKFLCTCFFCPDSVLHTEHTQDRHETVTRWTNRSGRLHFCTQERYICFVHNHMHISTTERKCVSRCLMKWRLLVESSFLLQQYRSPVPGFFVWRCKINIVSQKAKASKVIEFLPPTRGVFLTSFRN